MFDFTWQKKIKSHNNLCEVREIYFDRISVLFWEEHCLECAPPICYKTCSKYKKRIDGRCIRLKNGFVKNCMKGSPYGYTVDCQFEPWAKIETFINGDYVSPFVYKLIDGLYQCLLSVYVAFFKVFRIPNKQSMIFMGSFIKKVLRKISFSCAVEPNYFIFDCFSYEKDSYKIFLKCDVDQMPIFEYGIDIYPGENYIKIPYEKFNMDNTLFPVKMYIYPENNKEVCLTINFLDFVRLKADLSPKIKCIAWDLDNTLWNGVLIEDGIEGITLKKDVLHVIEELDKRGIIHTIVSKNNYEEAFAVLKKFGIDDLFVFPAINWGVKSENLKQVIKNINIGLDAVAFVDDNVRERMEVEKNLPQVRVYKDTDIHNFLYLEEFDTPITQMSKQRRLSYLSEMKRSQIKELFADNYDEFLRSLKLELQLFKPISQDDKERCFELLQRSNQLNLSTHRYTREEYSLLLDDSSRFNFAFSVSDQYGDYGIVGFVSFLVLSKNKLQMTDLVISCRVAQKKIENEMLYVLCNKYFARLGYNCLEANLYKTKKNGPLLGVFQSLPFDIISETEFQTCYILKDFNLLKSEKIVNIVLV